MKILCKQINIALLLSVLTVSCGGEKQSGEGANPMPDNESGSEPATNEGDDQTDPVNNPEADAETVSTNRRADDIAAAWLDWVNKYNPTQASIAISYNGELIREQGSGREATVTAPVASLSKAITGICVAKLVEGEQLTFDTRLQTVVPELASNATIGSLLTHTSGLKTDITQNPAGYPGVDMEYLLWVSQQELNIGVVTDDNQYDYNNANFAMLGAAISRITGKSYEQACNELVLAPAGISDSVLNPDWRIMSSWGGWKISALGYQKFVNAYFNSEGVLGKSPFDFPFTELNGGAHYGMGFLFREGRNGGFNFWHDGRWQADYNSVSYRFGAFFARWDNGWSVAVNHNISASGGAHGELDSLLAGAAHRP